MWTYTPRRVAGFLAFAERRKRREAAATLALHATAARGLPRDVKKQVKELQKD